MHAHLVPSLESPLMKFLTALALTLALATHAAAAPKNNEAANYFALLYAVEAPLHHAVKTNDFAAITALLDAGADPNAKDKHGWTPLHVAASYGHTAAITALASAGADPNVKIDKEGFTPLHAAAARGHTAAITALASAGADPNVKTDKEGFTPLHMAASNGHTAGITALASAGADPDAKNNYGDSSLHVAASKGHTTFISALIRAGVDPNVTNNRGYTPLDVADIAVIPALLDASADPNLMKSKSNTVISALRHTKPNPERLLAAANGGNLRTVVIQLLVGADPNAKDAEGFTPLHYAAVPLHIKIVELLLSSGANPNARDNSENLTPLELINLAYSKEADRVAIWGESTGLVGSLFARNRLNQYRKRAKPVEALLEQASREWSWLDTLRQKLDW